MLKVPVFPEISSDFTMTIILDNIRCTLRFMFNSKTKFWMLNTYEEPDNNIIISGSKITANYPFLYRYNKSFSGQLIVLRTTTIPITREITYDNFGKEWVLFYLTEEEFDLWSLANGF